MSRNQSPNKGNSTRSGHNIASATNGRDEFIDRNPLIANRFKLSSLIGSGTYGNVYEGKDKKTKKRVAVKVEGKKKGIDKEQAVYNVLFSFSDTVPGIPKPIFFGEADGKSFMVMDRLGTSLWEVAAWHGGTLSLKSVLMIGIQLVERLHSIHARGIVHLDVKPGNTMTGFNDPEKIYPIDFGHSKRIFDEVTKRHVQMRSFSGKGICGTLRYASVNAHKKIVLTRRDDLESLLYMLVELRHGLPWAMIPASSRDEMRQKLMEMKENISPSELLRDMPEPMFQFFKHIKDLHFSELPDYDLLTKLLMKALKSQGYKNDGAFDWIQKKRCTLGVWQ